MPREEEKVEEKVKKTKVKKGKKKRKAKQPSERWKKYKITGDKIERLARFCPRCGPGIFLVDAKDRVYCGRCHYTEFKKK
jgi:small subunit ribosomal protein S27Ae